MSKIMAVLISRCDTMGIGITLVFHIANQILLFEGMGETRLFLLKILRLHNKGEGSKSCCYKGEAASSECMGKYRGSV